MLTFHVIPLFLVIASEAWNLKVCACAMILDSSLRSATFRMTECQHYLEPRSCSRPARDGADLDVLALVDQLARPSIRPTSWGSARNRRARTVVEAVQMVGVILGYLVSWHDRGPGGRHDDGARSRWRGHPPPPPPHACHDQTVTLILIPLILYRRVCALSISL